MYLFGISTKSQNNINWEAMGCTASRDDNVRQNGVPHYIITSDMHHIDNIPNPFDADLTAADSLSCTNSTSTVGITNRKLRMLLLGAGESGKSTICRQMRILYGEPMTDEESDMFVVVIRSNVVVAVQKLVGYLEVSGLEERLYSDASCKRAYERVKKVMSNLSVQNAPQSFTEKNQLLMWHFNERAGIQASYEAHMFLELWKDMQTLWNTDVMQEVWRQRSFLNIIDGHKLFLQDLRRIAAERYRPTQEDVLFSRLRTHRIVREQYSIGGVEVELIDVGGQRSERKKWMRLLEGIDAVIFVAALSEYDQVLSEARRCNRMVEAIELFHSIYNNKAFVHSSIILFLNKKDLFAEKIKTSNIRDQKEFSDYSGCNNNFDDGVHYFIEKFKTGSNRKEISDNFIHVTNATDAANMEFVFHSTKSIVMVHVSLCYVIVTLYYCFLFSYFLTNPNNRI